MEPCRCKKVKCTYLNTRLASRDLEYRIQTHRTQITRSRRVARCGYFPSKRGFKYCASD
ncbi:unnamed protein product, partial [Callosobruchus maculatus]